MKQYTPKDLNNEIDPEKAKKLVERLRDRLRWQPIKFHDLLYGDQPPCRFYPSAILVNSEDIVDCGLD